jgi:hypothetical protein
LAVNLADLEDRLLDVFHRAPPVWKRRSRMTALSSVMLKKPPG